MYGHPRFCTAFTLSLLLGGSAFAASSPPQAKGVEFAMRLSAGMSLLGILALLILGVLVFFRSRAWSATLVAMAVTGAALLFLFVPAHAADVVVAAGAGTPVTVPYGNTVVSWMEIVRDAVTTAIIAGIGIAGRQLPGTVWMLLRNVLTENALRRGIDFGFNTVEGALKDKAVTVQVGNAVIANAMTYIVAHANPLIVKWLGGEQGIRDRIIARLPVAEGESLGRLATVPIKAVGQIAG